MRGCPSVGASARFNRRPCPTRDGWACGSGAGGRSPALGTSSPALPASPRYQSCPALSWHRMQRTGYPTCRHARTHTCFYTCTHVHPRWGTCMCTHTRCTGQRCSRRPWGWSGLGPVSRGAGREHRGPGRRCRGWWVSQLRQQGASGAQMGEAGGGACHGVSGWAAFLAPPNPSCCTTPPCHDSGHPKTTSPSAWPLCLPSPSSPHGQADPQARGRLVSRPILLVTPVGTGLAMPGHPCAPLG